MDGINTDAFFNDHPQLQVFADISSQECKNCSIEIIPHVLDIGAFLRDDNIDLMMVGSLDPSIGGTIEAYWLIEDKKVLVWSRRRDLFGHIKILSFHQAIEKSSTELLMNFTVGRVSSNWNTLLQAHNRLPV